MGARIESPYLGLVPYSEETANFFFGRTQDQRRVVASLFASRLSLLYGPPGVGKSSLLRAGVVTELQQRITTAQREGDRPEVAVIYFNKWQGDPIAAFRDAASWYVGARLSSAGREDALAAQTLSELATNIAAALDSDLFIIFDQFEEFFLYHGGQTPGAFEADFARIATRSGSPVSFLLSLRDDALAKLDHFKSLIPNLFATYVRLKPLTGPQAEEAITRPLTKYNALPPNEREHSGTFTIESSLIGAVIRGVQTGSVATEERGRGAGPTGDISVEAPYLQVVMSALWKHALTRGATNLTQESLSDLGGAETIVRNHLDSTLASLSESERDLCIALFEYLVTPSGTKIAYEAAHLAQLAHRDVAEVGAVLGRLVDQPMRVLATVPPVSLRDPVRYEIRHDSLGPAILEWRWRHAAERERIERERQHASDVARQQAELQVAQADAEAQRLRAEVEVRRAAEQRRFRRRFQYLAFAAVGLFAVALWLWYVAVRQRDVAQRSAVAARAAKDEVVSLSQQLQRLGDELSQRNLSDDERKRLAIELEAYKAQLSKLTPSASPATITPSAEVPPAALGPTRDELLTQVADLERRLRELENENAQLKPSTGSVTPPPGAEPSQSLPDPAPVAPLPPREVAESATQLVRDAWALLAGDPSAVLRKGTSPVEKRDKARALVARAIELEPTNANAYYVLGQVFMEGGQFADAEPEFRKALGFRADETTYEVALARALEGQEKWLEAYDTYERIQRSLQANPSRSAYFNSTSFNRQLANALLKLNRLDEAIGLYRATVAANPRSVLAHTGLADALGEKALREKRGMREAIAEYQQAVKLDPKSAAAHYGLGLALLRDRKARDAIREFERVLQLTPKDPRATFGLALALNDDGQRAKAEQTLRDYLALAPSDATEDQERLQQARELLAKLTARGK